jgi:hypothetical protein
MSLDFPNTTYRKILERIIPPPLGGWDKLHPDLSGFVFSLSHSQRVSNPTSLRFGGNSTCALMSLDFPNTTFRKILERIIPPPPGGRDKLHPDLSGFVFSLSRSQRVSNPTSLRFGGNSTCASNFAMLVLSECQIPLRYASGVIPLALRTSLCSFSASVIIFFVLI